MCNHDPKTKKHDYINVNLPSFEVYMCECGVLINYRDAKNYDIAKYPMNIEEVKEFLVVFSIKMIEEKISIMKHFLMKF